VTSSVAEANN